MNTNEKQTAVILIPVSSAERSYFQEQAPGWTLIFAEDPDHDPDGDAFYDQDLSALVCRHQLISDEQLLSAQVILGTPPLERIQASKNLRLLQTSSAGVDSYACHPQFPRQARLCCAKGAYGLAVSEHMLGMLFELFKNLHRYRDSQSQHQWADLGPARSIEAAKILVVGYGDIGASFAEKVHALGARVFAVRRTAGAASEFLEASYAMKQLDEILPEMDVVALSLPDSPETRGLFDETRIRRMKKGAVLLNVGRGPVVDTNALVRALNSGHLLGAGLDVTDPEPLPADHPLWREPGAVITPHISGLYHIRQTYERVVRICGENLKRWVEGQPLNNEMDPLTGTPKK